MAELKNKKPHPERRDYASAEMYAKRRKEINAARGKQVYVPGEVLTIDQLDAMCDEEISLLRQPAYIRVTGEQWLLL